MKSVGLLTAASVAALSLVAGCGIAPMLGLSGQAAGGVSFKAKTVDPPRWAKDAVFYQIFPERFANGDTSNDPKGVMPWGSKPENFNFMGGDLKGVRKNLDHLQSLGVNAIYLNPIFASMSNHKYDTIDYLKVDPAFGTMQDFKDLVADVHRRKMKIILDGVFNHTGDYHFAFQDASASGKVSPYWNWYNFYGYPVVYTPKPNYDSWWGFGSLPKLNYNQPDVPDYILNKVADFWGRQGIDGWRLDVPNEVTKAGFWEAFRKKVRSINPDAYIVGEIWDDPTPWLQGDKFDATMNYPFRAEILAFVADNKRNVDEFDSTLASQRGSQGAATNGMFNILGSHDTERIRTLLGNSAAKHRVAALVQFTYPGAPVVYYGDEYGMQGGKDPDDRRCFDWTKASWDKDTLAYYKKLIAIRKAHPSLRDGWFQTVMRHNDNGLYSYLRESNGKDPVLVVVNNGRSGRDVTLPLKDTSIADGTVLTDLISGKTFKAQGKQVVVSDVPVGGVILVPSDGKRPKR